MAPHSENTPPSTNPRAKVRGGIQGAARRRRARSGGGPHNPRSAVAHAKHRGSVKQQSPPIAPRLPSALDAVFIVDASSAGRTSHIPLPRYLSRPSFQQITPGTIISVAPELEGTALDYVREGLQCLGPNMLRVLAGIRAETPANVIPTQLEVVVNDLSSDMPTHMLAVFSRHVPAASKRRVTLFPIHNIILAAHCANLPALPPSDIPLPETPGSTISVPVVPLCIPAPDVFPQLSTFLYTKRIDHLLASLMPCTVPAPLYRDDPTDERVTNLLKQFASKIAKTHNVQTILTHTMAVNGLWRNACALGIDDEKLWCALDVAWEVLITALAVTSS